MRISNLKCGLVLIALTCFPMVIWIERIPRDKDSTAVGAARWTDLQNLYEHLHLAKKMEAEVSRDLRAVLQQLNSICQPVNNITVLPQNVAVSALKEMQQVLQRPNIHHYLPHLRQNLDSLSPNVVLGQGRHGDDVQSGLLEVVSPSPHYYPDFSTIKESLGDSKDRVRWRTKQNLDFSYLMHYAQDKGSYYIQLEDDVIAKSGYYDEIKAFTAQEASKDWLFLEFSQLGFIGKMFRTSDLHMISEFFLMFHKDKPVDWLLDHILWVKTCNPEKDAKHCNDQKALLKRQYKPSLFQHVGLHSSLLGKIQPLKDKAFETSKLYQAHNNPAAELSSSLTHYQQHSLERAYKGVDFFWALTPSQNDYILFKFLQPIHISGYLFRSGNIETSTDKFHNTTVEVLPRNASVRQKFLTSLPSAYKESDNGFIIVGAFASGLAEGAIEDALQPICAIRLVFQSDADVWAILSEISIKV
ncbi:hypothetical protein fugu_013582 [Takifugu bimaculatus]|uniref:Alpha-1,3-mannosyl-glycoprotein 4-beta-N-acetylglucosaminyltransferase B n=1 Tax=Takifugu bimaculatus TaxID=433685 RepID=A0A4Z2C4P9_9TELE|nr:hypothetical protein fugu_013582 [Takifugu bimaculatus]